MNEQQKAEYLSIKQTEFWSWFLKDIQRRTDILLVRLARAEDLKEIYRLQGSIDTLTHLINFEED